MINQYFIPFLAILRLSQSQTVKRFFFSRSQKIRTHQSLFIRNHQFKFSQQKKGSIQTTKKQSQQFYDYHVQNIIELQQSQDWPQVVGSITEPLIIDFYADWCGPCKKLTPILEEKVKKSNGKIKLLKVNIDKCGQLAQKMKITSVPTVYAVYKGQGVDFFQGLPDNSKIDQLFNTLNKFSQITNQQQKHHQTLEQGKRLLSQGKYQEAEKILLQVSEKDTVQMAIALKQIFLVQCYLSMRKIAKFKDQVEKIKKFESLYLSNPELKEFYELILAKDKAISDDLKELPEVALLKQALQSQPNDLQSKYRLAEVYKSHEMMKECLEQLIEILKADKNWEDKKTQKFMLNIFQELGNGSLLTQKYRKIMQRLLY